MPTRSDIEQFIAATCRSVWTLELLGLLRAHGAPMGHDQMVAALRGSDMIVAQSLSSLVVAGLVIVDDDGEATYRPSSSELDEVVAGAEDFFSKSPNAVRRIIASSWDTGLAAFADAFRFRKDEK